MTTRSKPGVGALTRLAARELKLKKAYVKLEGQKTATRERFTGKTKAQAYVRIWLAKLTATELKHECEIRGFLYGEFETMEQAMESVVQAIFAGVVAQEETAELVNEQAMVMDYQTADDKESPEGEAIP